MAEYTPDETLDARGLSCPMPLLKTKKQLAKMQSGQILEVLGTLRQIGIFLWRERRELIGCITHPRQEFHVPWAGSCCDGLGERKANR